MKTTEYFLMTRKQIDFLKWYMEYILGMNVPQNIKNRLDDIILCNLYTTEDVSMLNSIRYMFMTDYLNEKRNKK